MFTTCSSTGRQGVMFEHRVKGVGWCTDWAVAVHGRVVETTTGQRVNLDHVMVRDHGAILDTLEV